MSRPLRGLLIGAGFFSRNQLHAWAEVDGAEIAAICDLDPARAEAAAREFAIPAWHTGANVLREGGFDFVDICTTMETHEALVGLAVASGVPVIVQKPFAPDLATCRRIEANARLHGVRVMLHENFRFQKLFRRLREILDSGEIGATTFARLSWRNDIDVYSNQPYLLETRRFIIMDVGIHLLDLTRFLMGDVTEVRCVTQSIKEGLKGEDAATLLLRHGDGAVSIVDVSYASHRNPNPFPETLAEVEGRKGTVVVSAGEVLTVQTAAGRREERIGADGRGWTAPPWTQIQDSVPRVQQHFIDCLRSGAEFETSARDSLKTYALAEAAYLSAARGTAVSTSELLAESVPT